MQHLLKETAVAQGDASAAMRLHGVGFMRLYFEHLACLGPAADGAALVLQLLEEHCVADLRLIA